MSAAPALVPVKMGVGEFDTITYGPGAGIFGVVSARPVTAGATVPPVGPNVATWRTVGWGLPFEDQLTSTITRLKSSGWLSPLPSVLESEHQLMLPECDTAYPSRPSSTEHQLTVVVYAYPRRVTTVC